MKTFLSSLALCAFIGSTLAAPEPTQAPQVIKRQLDGIDVSAIVANPSSALAEISPLLANPTFRSIFSSVTADPAFQSSIQAELVSDYGSQSASAILQEYTSLIASLTANDAAGATSMSSSSSSSSSGSETSTSSTATELTSPKSVAGSGTGGSSGAAATYTLAALMGSAISMGVAVVLLA